jgi:hypothetical protein
LPRPFDELVASGGQKANHKLHALVISSRNIANS